MELVENDPSEREDYGLIVRLHMYRTSSRYIHSLPSSSVFTQSCLGVKKGSKDSQKSKQESHVHLINDHKTKTI